MAKKNPKKKEESGEERERSFTITSAGINDGLCNYSFENTSGVGTGDIHSVKGKGIINDDLTDSFAALSVHLAAIDDVFKHGKIEVTDINSMRGHELATIYAVTGFKIKGQKEDESIVLIGTKYVTTAGGHIELESPKIPMDNMSSYPFHKELKVVADTVREEVALYAEGKCTIPEPAEVTDAKQMTIGDAIKENEQFEDGKV